MIGSLRGTVARTGAGEVVIDVGGVGYRVVASPPTIASLTATGGEVSVSIHTHVREDALVLYGFASDEDRSVFETLLGTHGVGPALAMSILATLGSAEVVRAVQDQDPSAFEAVAGVGKKTAARLVLELAGALASTELAASPSTRPPDASGAREDVAAALAELGYGPEEVRHALGALDGTESVEEALRVALRELRRP